MAQITRFPLINYIRSDASNHVQYFRNGNRMKTGRGQAFWFATAGASISEMPMDDREQPFLLNGQSADYQDLAVQGQIVWRVVDPELLGDRIDFTISLRDGYHVGQPMDQIGNVLVALTRQFTNDYLKRLSIRELLERGVTPLRSAVSMGFSEDRTLGAMGLELVNANIEGLAPSSELARALQAPTFESLQQQADEATFLRRASAVEKERAIAENELNNKIELAARQKELIAREDENTRSEARAHAAAKKITAEAEAERIRAIDQARADMEKERINGYAGVPAPTLMAIAAQEFATKLDRIDSLTITPDMLSGFVTQIRTAFNSAEANEGTVQ